MALLHLITVQSSYDSALMIYQDSVDARCTGTGKFLGIGYLGFVNC